MSKMVIEKQDLILARKGLDQIRVSGVENCKLIMYIDQLLQTAKEAEEEEVEKTDGSRKHS